MTRYFPLMVLYSLALVLVLSIAFNVWISYKASWLEGRLATETRLAFEESTYWEQQFNDCHRQSITNDSLIKQLSLAQSGRQVGSQLTINQTINQAYNPVSKTGIQLARKRIH